MKRTILISLSLVLLLAVLTACGQQANNQTQTIATTVPEESLAEVSQENKESLLSAWESALKVHEVLYSCKSWTLDYVEAFSDDNNWDSLLKARAACLSTKTAFEKTPLPEYSLLQGQYDELQAGGIDAELVKNEYLLISETVRTDIATMRSLDLLLHEEVFYRSVFAEFDTWCRYERSAMEDIAEYYCAATNYLLLQLNMPEVWEQMPEKFPNLFRHAAQWIPEEEAAVDAATGSLDRYEQQIVEMNAFQGAQEYSHALVKEALETKNLDYLAQEINKMEGVPAYIPIADWLLDDVKYEYLVTDPETQKKVSVRSGEKITSTPSALYVECAGISLEEVQGYAQQLADWELPVAAGWETEGETYHVFTKKEDIALIVEWTEESTTFYMSGSLGCLTTELLLLTQSVK